MTRIFSFLVFLTLLAPAAAWAQSPLYLNAAIYVIRDMTEAVPPPVVCQGDNNAFSRKAEDLITTRIDGERAQFAPGAPPLQPDADLIRIAQQRSCDMAHGAAFSHIDAQGHFIAADMVRQIFGPYGAVGENIAQMGNSMELIGVRPFGPEEFARAAVDAWMDSPEHRANILNLRFDASGIGVVKVDGEAVATQIFHGPPPKQDDGKP